MNIPGMNTLGPNINKATAVALLASVFSHCVIAEDVISPIAQSDEQVSLWVNDASLELFIAQLAVVTGRDVIIEGSLEGSVTGEFNGSMMETLGTVGEQFPVLFDLQETTLGVVSDAALRRESFALADSDSYDELLKTLLASVVPGNSIEIGDSELIVSGHPSFVERVGQSVAQNAADDDKKPSIASTFPAEVATQAVSPADGQNTLDEEGVMAAPSEQVVDTANSVMLPDESMDTDKHSETASVDATVNNEARPILWVTDIPGFETF